MSKWNWVHAGLQAATYHEMRQVKAALERQAARQVVVEAIRHYIFNLAKYARLLIEHSQAYPVQVYSMLIYLQKELERSGIEESHLPEVADKEYLFNVKLELEKNLQKLREKISDREARKAEFVAGLLLDRPLLEEIIRIKEIKDSMRQTESKWRRLSSKYSWRVPLFTFLVIFMICMGCPCASTFAEPLYESSSVAGSFLGILIRSIPILITLTGIAGLIMTLLDKRYKEYKEMAKIQKEWMQIMKEWNNKVGEIAVRFGTDDIDELYKIAKRGLNLLHTYFPIKQSPFKEVLQLPSNTGVTA